MESECVDAVRVARVFIKGPGRSILPAERHLVRV